MFDNLTTSLHMTEITHGCLTWELVDCRTQGCQFSNFVAIFSKFSDPSSFSEFLFRKLAKYIVTIFLELTNCIYSSSYLKRNILVYKISHLKSWGREGRSRETRKWNELTLWQTGLFCMYSIIKLCKIDCAECESYVALYFLCFPTNSFKK